MTYAKAISDIASGLLKIKVKVTDENTPPQRRAALEEEIRQAEKAFPNKMSFLFEKQQAHPGIQPHEACVKILENTENVDEDHAQFLKELKEAAASDDDRVRDERLREFAAAPAPISNMSYVYRWGNIEWPTTCCRQHSRLA